MNTLWSQRFAQRTQRMHGSAVRELLKLTAHPEVISFAGGLPAPEVFPVREFEAATVRVLSEHGPEALQYGLTEGWPKLREMIARHMARYGILVNSENILITSGSQQALDLIGKVFINPGDRILVEKPTYLGALQAWSAYQAEFIGVPIDQNGMLPYPLESALRAGPKFIYALPNFQNPTGATLNMERRTELVRLADRNGVPLIEDDPYGQLRYEGAHLPPLVSIDARRRNGKLYSGNVIYLSTFSKTLAPGLRLAWVVAPVEVIERLAQAKQGSDLHTSTFVQMVAYEVARGGFLDRHVRHIRTVYRARRDAMLDALGRHFPAGVRWTKPHGGLFLWATLPPGIDASDVLKAALEQKVAFVPGANFYSDGSGTGTMRLNFSNSTPERIEEGIRRLGSVLRVILKPSRQSGRQLSRSA